MRSTFDVDAECLADTVFMLGRIGIRIVGSREAEGVVCLAIEGDIVPDEPKVMIEFTSMIGSIVAQLTATCRPVAAAQQVTP